MARNIRQCQGARPFFWQTCITLNPKEGVRLQHWKMGGVRWAIASQPGRVAKITWKRIRLVTGRQFVSFRERKIVLLIRVQSEVGKKNQQESRKAAAQFEDPSSELTDWNLVKLAPALSAVTLKQVSMWINVQFSKDRNFTANGFTLKRHKVSRINMDSNWSEQCSVNIKGEQSRDQT